MYLLAYGVSEILRYITIEQWGEILKGSEQRKEPRYIGKIPVQLASGQGITRDFSTSGVFFETDCSFSLGQPIDFTLVLEHYDPERPVHLKCRGKITRVEESGQKIGVATAIDSCAIE
jgi:hypothetical protein